MRIAMIGQKGLPAHSGGVERHVDELATRLVSAGNEVLVYCRKYYTLNGNYATDYRGVQLRYIPTIKAKSLDAMVSTFIASIDVLFQKVDVVHYHGIGPALFAWIPRFFAPQVKVIITYHCQDYFHGKWGFCGRTGLRMGEWCACHFSHQLIVVSKTLKSLVKRRYGRTATYIPNGVSLAKRVVPKKISKLGLSRGNYFLIVSRLVPHKGIHFAIKAYNQLSASMSDVLPKLVIVGGGSFTDSYVRSLKKMAKDNPNIMMLGPKSGEVLAELYSNAKLFIQPSQSEGLSIALLEAMSYGCPVLVSDIAENKEVLPCVGRTFENGNVESLAHALQRVLIEKHESRQTAVYREHVERYYEAVMVFHKALRLYRQQVTSQH